MSHTCRHGYVTSCWGRNKGTCRKCHQERMAALSEKYKIEREGLQATIEKLKLRLNG